MSRAILLEMRKKKTSHVFHFIMCCGMGVFLGLSGVALWMIVWFICVLSNMLENWKIDKQIEKVLASGD